MSWIRQFNCVLIRVMLVLLNQQARCFRQHCWVKRQHRAILARWTIYNAHFCYLDVLSPGQTIATSQRNISQHCWPSICKLRPNDRSIVRRSMLHAFGHPVATCCDMLRVENRPSTHILVQRHHATSINVAWKIWQFSNMSQQHPTCRNRVAKRAQQVAPNNVAMCCDMLRWNVAIVWPGL